VLAYPVSRFLYHSLPGPQSPYYDYKIKVSRKYLRALFLSIGLINLLLLVPDLMLLEHVQEKTVVIVLRTFFSAYLIYWFHKEGFKSSRQYILAAISSEIMAYFLFLYVFSQYTEPNFMIQTLGLIFYIVIVFFVPNLFFNALIINLLGAAGYFMISFLIIKPLNLLDFWSSVVYTLLVIGICSVSAYMSELYQYREYMAKIRLEELSSTDYLTQAANRFKLEEEAEKWMDFCRRQKLPLSLVFLDVDNMKLINDHFGHGAGDSVLTSLSRLIQAQLRSSDILARWGGDEFVLLLPNATLSDAITMTERLRIIVKEFTFLNGIHTTCSFGVTELREETDFKDLVRAADKRMYRGKELGKDRIHQSK
jgi:two-component system cell cycle response regulator